MYQNDKTGFIKEPTVKEMADLVVLVLNSVKTIERAIESKRLDIDKKYAAPVEQALNKNQSETAAVLSWVTKEVNGLLALGESAVNQTTAQLETQVQQALANIRSGKDGIVTEAEIQRAADMALGMLELPDFDAMVSEAFTKNGEAIRNALELLSGDERYKVEIADVVGLQEMLSQLAAIRANGGGGIGKTQVYNFIRQAIDEGIITSGGVTTFTALTDAPNSYVGQAGKFPKVNATEDGLEFATISGGGDALTSNPLSQFAPTTKAQLDGVISDGNVMYVGDAPTAHTHPAANITDFDTEVSNNTDVAANTAARHAAVTVTDSAEINFTLTGQDITASLLAGSIDETKLDASVNASLDLADSAVQPGDPLTDLSGDLPFSQIAQIATTRILGRETAGTGDIESLTAAQARNVIGLDTDDSPHFTAVNIGHATDTTVTRVSAGVIAVEGVTILRTSDVDDVPVNGETAAPISSNWAFDHEADTSTHGVTGAIVGTTDTQTLTNKTLTSDTNKLRYSKTLVVEDPTSAEDISFFFSNRAITVTEMRAVLVGSATPSVTWTIRHGTDRSAAGAEVVTSGTTTTGTTSGSDVVSFNDATVVADSFVWLETTAKSGTVDEIQVTIFYTED